MPHPFNADQIDDLGSFLRALFGGPDDDIPDYWMSQAVKLRENQRSVEATIPAMAIGDVGLEHDDLPTVTAYYDPHTQFVFYDLGGQFDESES